MTSFSPFSLTFFRVGGLGLRLISGKRRIMGLGLFLISIESFVALLPISVILVLFDPRFISFWAPEIDFSCPGKWLEAGLCFYINSLLYHLVLRIQILPLIAQLSSNRQMRAFSKVAYQDFLVGRCNRVEFLEDSL